MRVVRVTARYSERPADAQMSAMRSPLVTVYMPTRDRRDLLARAVASVLGQSYERIELVVVDDGSRDGSREWLRELAAHDPRVRPLFNDSSLGACAARNRALEAARGDFITGCDDDDLFLPHRVEELLACWDRMEAEGLSCSAVYTPYLVRQRVGRESPMELPATADPAAIKCSNAVGPQVFAPAQVFRRSGGFDPQLPAWQDYDLWFRIILEQGPMRRVGTATYVMDQSHDQPRISTDRGSRIRAAYEQFLAKHGDRLDGRERALLHLNYLQYDQVRFPASALLQGWRAGELHAYAGGMLAKILRRLPG